MGDPIIVTTKYGDKLRVVAATRSEAGFWVVAMSSIERPSANGAPWVGCWPSAELADLPPPSQLERLVGRGLTTDMLDEPDGPSPGTAAWWRSKLAQEAARAEALAAEAKATAGSSAPCGGRSDQPNHQRASQGDGGASSDVCRNGPYGPEPVDVGPGFASAWAEATRPASQFEQTTIRPEPIQRFPRANSAILATWLRAFLDEATLPGADMAMLRAILDAIAGPR
jgi:hypothetical protein